MGRELVAIVKRLEKHKPKDVILLEGLVGLGSVAQLTAETIIKQKGAVKLAEFYSPYLGHIVLTTRPGYAELPRYDLYWFSHENTDYLVLYTQFWQPKNDLGNFLLNYEVFDYIRKVYKPKFVLTMGGLIIKETREEKEEEQVYYIFTSEEAKNFMEQRLGQTIENLTPQYLQVAGAAGLFLGFAQLHNIPGACILVEVRDPVLDIYAVKKLTEEVNRIFNLGLNMKEIEEKIKEQEELLKEIKEKTEEILRRIKPQQDKYRI
ncbi:MAG: hypothetical protein GXO42_00230 [bacterium]|nr:hypothetical protein [bacterium]